MARSARRSSGLHRAFESLGDSGRAALERDLIDLVNAANRSGDDTLVIDAEYPEAVAVCA